LLELADDVREDPGHVAELALQVRIAGLVSYAEGEQFRLGDMRACGAECQNFVVGCAGWNVKLHQVIPLSSGGCLSLLTILKGRKSLSPREGLFFKPVSLALVRSEG
jgi:hypothetical protein